MMMKPLIHCLDMYIQLLTLKWNIRCALVKRIKALGPWEAA